MQHIRVQLGTVLFLMLDGIKLVHHSAPKAVVIMLKTKAVPVPAAKWVGMSEMWIILFVVLPRL